MRSQLRDLLSRAVAKTAKEGELDYTELPPLVLEPPKQREFGDLSCNIAMHWGKLVKKAPRSIAECILNNIEDSEGILARKEVAGPGFLNFTFSREFYYQRLRELAVGKVSAPDIGRGKTVQVEFASVNPTGPLHVGHGRVAVIGDVLARLHQATGFQVQTEYYVNDAGNQMDNLGLSLYVRYCELFGREMELPEGGYPGDYLKDIAAQIKNKYGDKFLKESKEVAVKFFRRYGGDALLKIIRSELQSFRIHFDSFFSETAMRERNEVAQSMDILRAKGLLFSQDNAEWFRSTEFGDDKDRAVVKSDGDLTYFASDIAYHRNKLERKYSKLINVWGADHHGYVARLKAALQALGYDRNRLEVVLVQMVQLMRAGAPVRMGKRSGEFVALRDVLSEVGIDAARFFFLMRKSDTHLDFDLDLAKRQSSDNPVFYVQYAHARVASVFAQAHKNGLQWAETDFASIVPERLELTEEIDLIRKMTQFNDVLEDTLDELEPHRIVFYLLDLSGEFHRYYNRTRILSEDRELTRARMLLAQTVQSTIRRGLEILGVDAPMKMASRFDSPEADGLFTRMGDDRDGGES